jgi:hypothetical protein
MPAMIFQVMRLLDREQIPFLVTRTREEGLTIVATTVGRRIEIFVDESEMVDVSVFVGSEDVTVGVDAVSAAISDDGQ